jgi:hypothetical protein
MSTDFADWYWGRVHGPHTSLVYLTTPGSNHEVRHVADVSADGIVAPWSSAVIRLERRSINFMGLLMYRRVVIEGIDASRNARMVVCDNAVVCEDGPFYQRYISQWTDGGKSIGLGMSEYMNVQRLCAPWIRPFLRLPWTAEQHGVRT